MLSHAGNQQAVAGLRVTWVSCCASTDPVVVVAGIDWESGLSYASPGPAKAVINCQVAPGQSQAVTDIGLHVHSSKETLKLTHPVANFRPQQSTILRFAPEVAHLNSRLGRQQSRLGQIVLHGVSPNTAAVLVVNLHSL